MDIVEVDTTLGIKPALITLLQDSVTSGASVGFLPPLTEEQANTVLAALVEKAGGHLGEALLADRVEGGNGVALAKVVEV